MRSLINLRPAIVGRHGRGLAGRGSTRLSDFAGWLSDESCLVVSTSILAICGGYQIGDSCILAVGLALDASYARSSTIAFRFAFNTLQTREGRLVAFLFRLHPAVLFSLDNDTILAVAVTMMAIDPVWSGVE